jgi:hypothetical protein
MYTLLGNRFSNVERERHVGLQREVGGGLNISVTEKMCDILNLD